MGFFGFISSIVERVVDALDVQLDFEDEQDLICSSKNGKEVELLHEALCLENNYKIARLMKKIAPTTERVVIRISLYKDIDVEKLCYCLQLIPTHITRIHLDVWGLFNSKAKIDLAQLLLVIAAIPAHITDVVYIHPNFDSINLEHAIQLVQTFPCALAKLTFLSCALDRMNDLVLFLQSLSFFPQLKSLSLVQNTLERSLNTVMSAIPENIEHLSLESCLLLVHLVHASSFIDGLKKTPPWIKSLDLRGNGLKNLSMAQLDELGNALPYLEHIYLTSFDIPDGEEQRCALRKIFPNIRRIVVDKDFKMLIAEMSPIEQTNSAIKYGFTVEVPSLLNQCAFFIRSNKEKLGILDAKQAVIPEELHVLLCN
ncbi:hypothetical protein [Legionella drancourtii]|uniref:Leucine-rich repeat-containing protein n=1 Tax=Legionella drancourtii LLAP12 TaxID=658187 RepID=G9EQQ9_9GAMM|nr:hypothetical protein [Legionella drancourtii]EHL30280.1 hypothetical protein LDG_7610 [Legionella drancourtii LLAP12]